jgi:hypothetical protein
LAGDWEKRITVYPWPVHLRVCGFQQRIDGFENTFDDVSQVGGLVRKRFSHPGQFALSPVGRHAQISVGRQDGRRQTRFAIDRIAGPRIVGEDLQGGLGQWAIGVDFRGLQLGKWALLQFSGVVQVQQRMF